MLTQTKETCNDGECGSRCHVPTDMSFVLRSGGNQPPTQQVERAAALLIEPHDREALGRRRNPESD
jgi:hypothetical protein